MKKLFLFNGWGSTADCWKKILPALTDAGLSCVPLDWTANLQQPASNLIASRGVASSEGLWLAGWSLGGMLALQAASALLAEGVPVQGLLLIASTARMTREGEYPGVEARLLKAMKLRLRQQAAAQMADFAALCFSPQPADAHRADAQNTADPTATDCAEFAAGAVNLPVSLLTEGLEYLQNTDLRPLLAGSSNLTQLPAIILHGEADAVIPCPAGEALARLLPRAGFRSLKNAPHALPYTHPDGIIQTVRELITR